MAYFPSALITLNDLIKQYALSTSAATGVSATTQAVIDSLDTVQRTQLKQLLFDVSDTLLQDYNRNFLPCQATETIYPSMDAWDWRYQGGVLKFMLQGIPYGDLLSLSAIGLDSVVQDSAGYRLEGFPPYDSITFDLGATSVPSGSSFTSKAEFTGIWGYHENPSIMWKSNGALLGALNDSATSFTATTGTIETYQYLKIDSEFLFVTAVTVGATDTITVERGARGTTAANHLISAAIYKYQQMPVVIKAVRRRCVNLMQKMPELANLVQIGESTFEASSESLDLPDSLRRWTVRSV